jgi:hypothetical protein
MELYIRILESVEKKKRLAPGFAKQLEALHLTELYTRTKFLATRPRPQWVYDTLLRMWAEGDLKGAAGSPDFELVDFSNKTLDKKNSSTMWRSSN